MSVLPVIALGAVKTFDPKEACTAFEKTSQALESIVNGEIGLGSCPRLGNIVMLPIEGASESELPFSKSEYFSATGLMRLRYASFVAAALLVV